MTRKEFLQRLGLLGVAAVVAPSLMGRGKVPASLPPIPDKPVDYKEQHEMTCCASSSETIMWNPKTNEGWG